MSFENQKKIYRKYLLIYNSMRDANRMSQVSWLFILNVETLARRSWV